ncbi:Ff.00g055840.m01.CDS01 [Fusarium sp. VM40]|nr:Ff.00g055840.m01.CDS01 [Fusarium sp. VM40]
MKFSLLTVTLSTLAAASPTPEMEHEKRALGLLKPKTSNIPFTFTSTYEITATPNQVVDAENKFTGGLKNSHGLFKYGINSHEDIICFNITLYGFRGEYESLANTATHIHEGVKGKAGPPRIAFPNPVGNDKFRNSVGCLKGPFRTGIKANGQDTGVGFTVAQIEKNPAKFFTDSHSSLAVPGAFRGQLDSGKKC